MSRHFSLFLRVSSSDDQAGSGHQQGDADGPLAVQGDRTESEQPEMVKEDAGGQLGADDHCHGRGRADAGDGDDGHGDEEGTETPSGKLPPGGACKTLERSLAGDQDHCRKKQGADGKGDAGTFERADLLRQTPVDGRLDGDGDTTAEHQGQQQNMVH